MVRLARTSRCAIVFSGERNARAISSVEKPATTLSVSATWLYRGSTAGGTIPRVYARMLGPWELPPAAEVGKP